MQNHKEEIVFKWEEKIEKIIEGNEKIIHQNINTLKESEFFRVNKEHIWQWDKASQKLGASFLKLPQQAQDQLITQFVKQAEYITKGYTYSRLSHLSYEKNETEFKKMLRKSFEDNFELIAKSPEGGLNSLTHNGMDAYILKDPYDTKIIVLRGTEASDPWDLDEDAKIALNILPWDQIEEAIDFINQHITPDDRVIFVGHSLGWVLAQILTTMYPQQVEETYTFNAPWAKDMRVPSALFDKKYTPYLKKYQIYQRDPSLENKIINYKASEMIWKYGKSIGQTMDHLHNQSHRIIDANDDFVNNYILNSTDTQDSYASYEHIIKLKSILQYDSIKGQKEG